VPLTDSRSQDRPSLQGEPSLAAAYARHASSLTDAAHAILRNRAEAQDVVQDVFLRLWRRPESYDAARGELEAYLRLLVRSRALDRWRQGVTARRAAERLASEGDRGKSPETPEDALVRSVDRTTLRSAVRELPAGQREALALVYWGDLTAEQVAARTRVPLGTAKSRVRLGLQRLRHDHSSLAA
jgi:RNA polymerase sigma-70 factor (ECF subfamily)